MKVALAAFVKTPGASPIKTRLSHSIGKEKAEAFYLLSVEATEAMMRESTAIVGHAVSPYWAVAEQDEQDNVLWQEFPRVWTGEGGLGDRLATVFDELYREYDVVCLVGSDCPQLSAQSVQDALEVLFSGSTECVIGPAQDGGFYLFASRKPIPGLIWQAVPYSVSNTRESLLNKLEAEGFATVVLDAVERDVDTQEDLMFLYKLLSEDKQLSPIGKKLKDGIKQTLF